MGRNTLIQIFVEKKKGKYLVVSAHFRECKGSPFAFCVTHLDSFASAGTVKEEIFVENLIS